MLGLPDTTAARLFDLGGVLTQTATVPARACKEPFDDLLALPGEPAFARGAEIVGDPADLPAGVR